MPRHLEAIDIARRLIVGDGESYTRRIGPGDGFVAVYWLSEGLMRRAVGVPYGGRSGRGDDGSDHKDGREMHFWWSVLRVMAGSNEAVCMSLEVSI
jgi:hypothetical protein